MKDAVEIDLGGVVYLPNFLKIGSGIIKLSGGRKHTDTHAQRARRFHKPTF
jgi:hypothetical protein